MRAKYIITGVVALVAGMCVSCTKMNDIHDEFLKDGPIVYVGRLDSLHAYTGIERAKIEYWITDPRAKSVTFKWNNDKDSINVVIPSHDPVEMQTVMISQMGEGDFTLNAISYDGLGHRSIVFEQLISVYGERYISTLANRGIMKVVAQDNIVTISWGGSTSKEEVGIEVEYKDLDGTAKTVFFDSASLGSGSVIENVNTSSTIKYRTAYKPDPENIDFFFAAYKEIDL